MAFIANLSILTFVNMICFRLTLMAPLFNNYDVKYSIAMKKYEADRYKRICETVQEGIITFKGTKVIFFNDIFRNILLQKDEKKD